MERDICTSEHKCMIPSEYRVTTKEITLSILYGNEIINDLATIFMFF
jgi:hypothetical protein